MVTSMETIGTGSAWLMTSADAPLSYTPGAWNHVAYVVTPTGYTIYANGAAVGSGSFAATSPLLYGAGHTLMLGATGYSGEFLTGVLDEVRISNTARSTA